MLHIISSPFHSFIMIIVDIFFYDLGQGKEIELFRKFVKFYLISDSFPTIQHKFLSNILFSRIIT